MELSGAYSNRWRNLTCQVKKYTWNIHTYYVQFVADSMFGGILTTAEQLNGNPGSVVSC